MAYAHALNSRSALAILALTNCNCFGALCDLGHDNGGEITNQTYAKYKRRNQITNKMPKRDQDIRDPTC